MTGLYLGIDGGGTKTEFVCLDGDGRRLAGVVAGTTYHPQVGIEGARATLTQGVEALCSQLQVRPADLTYAFFGLPAFGEDRAADGQLDDACSELLGHDRYRCGNDMVCGWAGSLGCRDGINLIAGTGSIAYGERAGLAARCGGWGEVFSDEGSAYWIAVRGLNAFSCMSDGRLPLGPLHGHVARALGLGDDIELCARIMGENAMSRDEIAGLAQIVSDAAADGDEAASAILTDAVGELLSMARALRERLGYPPDERARLSGSGGVLMRQPHIRAGLQAAARSDGSFVWVEPQHSPAIGAAMYALHLSTAADRVQ